MHEPTPSKQHAEITRLFSFLLIAAFFLLTLGSLSAWNTPATGYENSIYASTPMIYWVALAFCFIIVFLQIFFILKNIALPRHLIYASWLLLSLCMITLTTLLIIRGYYGYNFNGDTGSHVGNLLMAMTSGNINQIYPNLYCHTLILTYFTGGDLLYIIKITPPLFILMFIIGIYVLSRKIFPKKEMAILSAFVACSLPFGSVSNYTGSLPLPCYLPYTLTLLLFTPLCLYTIYTIVNNPEQRKTFVLLAIILFVSALFYHILACAILLIFIIVLYGCIIFQRKKYVDMRGILLSLSTVILVTVIGWVFWTALLQYLNVPVNSIYNALFADDTGTVYSTILTNQLGMAFGGGMDLPDVLNVLITQFGSTGIVLLFIALSIPIVYFCFRNTQMFKDIIPLYVVTVPLIGLAGVSLLSWLSFQPGRVIMFVTIIGILLSGIVLYVLLSSYAKKDNKILSYTFVIIALGLLLSIFVLGLHLYYPTIEVHSSLSYNSLAEVDGMKFYFENGNMDYQYLGLPHAPLVIRFVPLIYGIRTIPNPTYSNMISASTIQNHFGYDTESDLTEIAAKNSYLLINAKDLKYQREYNLWKKYRMQWTDEDYHHLDNDREANKVFNNEEMKWYIYS